MNTKHHLVKAALEECQFLNLSIVLDLMLKLRLAVAQKENEVYFRQLLPDHLSNLLYEVRDPVQSEHYVGYDNRREEKEDCPITQIDYLGYKGLLLTGLVNHYRGICNVENAAVYCDTLGCKREELK